MGMDDQGTNFIITNSGSLAGSSQLTLTNGCQFMITNGSMFTQGFPLKVFPGPMRENGPMLTNNGVWLSSDALTINGVPVSGTGGWNQTTGVWSFTNVDFTVPSLDSKQGSSVNLVQGNFNIMTMTGAGTVLVNSGTMKSTTANLNSLTIGTGTVNFGSVVLNALNLTQGSQLTVNSATAGNINWQGGSLSGISNTIPPTSTINVGQTFKVTGTGIHLLQNVVVTATKLSLKCVVKQLCELQFNNAEIN